MYLDSVVLSGIAIVVLTCAVFYYVGLYAYRHFKQDVAEHPEESKAKNKLQTGGFTAAFFSAAACIFEGYSSYKLFKDHSAVTHFAITQYKFVQ